MVATESTMVELGSSAPAFSLPDPVAGKAVSLDDFAGASALVVAFICNHCPFVKHLRSALADFGRECQTKGAAMVAISSNDITTHPDDAPDKMAVEAREAGYTFPYLYDESQDVAKAYRAACTPDFYVYDGHRRLVYRGQFDDTRPGGPAPTGADLRRALDAALAGEAPLADQRPSMGCNIKWTPGREPAYFKA